METAILRNPAFSTTRGRVTSSAIKPTSVGALLWGLQDCFFKMLDFISSCCKILFDQSCEKQMLLLDLAIEQWDILKDLIKNQKWMSVKKICILGNTHWFCSCQFQTDSGDFLWLQLFFQSLFKEEVCSDVYRKVIFYDIQVSFVSSYPRLKIGHSPHQTFNTSAIRCVPEEAGE